jgi:uncharacterized protein YegP (UPF0339 family)
MGLFSKIFKKIKKPDEHEQFLKSEYRSGSELEKEPLLTYVDLKDDVTKKKTQDKKAKDKKCEEKKTSDTNEPKQKSNKTGFFDVKKTKDGRYVFNLYASNNVIVATSQTYSSSQSALAGIKSITVNAQKAAIEDSTVKGYETLPYPKWEIYRDKSGEFRFRLSASNGSCICHSQGYSQKSSCKNGIASIIRTVKDAKIDKTYLEKK